MKLSSHFHFTQFHIEDVKSASHSPIITARKAGVLNEKMCSKKWLTLFTFNYGVYLFKSKISNSIYHYNYSKSIIIMKVKNVIKCQPKK